MNANRFAVAVFGVLSLTTVACGRYAILTVPAVSMTNTSVEASAKGTPAGHVEAKYCPGDDSSSKDGNVGLIDEAVLKAQKQSGATYLTDVTVSREGSCVIVEGMAMK